MPKKIKARTKSSKTRTRATSKKSSLWFVPKSLKFFKGDAAIYIILGIIVMGGVFLAGGIFPKVSDQTLDKAGGEAQIDPDSLPKGGSKESLQLQTLKFKRCAEVAAIEFILDNSGSMGDPPFPIAKMDNLKKGVTTFTDRMNDKSVVAIRTFSDGTTLRVPFGFYANNKDSVRTTVASMVPYGTTRSRLAFSGALSDLTDAVSDDRFKKYNFSVIFFSDGIPEDGSAPPARCVAADPLCTYSPTATGQQFCRCFAPNQDPTDSSQSGGNVAEKIKALKSQTGTNVRIFSVLLFDPARDGYFETKFKTLMKAVASDSSSYFETTEAEGLESIFSQISGKVCE